MKRNHILRTIICTLICLVMITPALADVLTLPSGTKVIEDYAFYGDSSIDEVVLPEGIEEIGEYAFAESGLTKINLPSSLEEGSIADNAIDKDKDVEVTAIKGTDAYNWAVDNGYISEVQESPLDWFEFEENDDGLTCTLKRYCGLSGKESDIVIPTKDKNGHLVTKIGDNAFNNFYSMTGKLIIPNSVKIIGDYAFHYCGFTGNLIIPDGVEKIGAYAFSECNGFTGDLIIPDSVMEIGEYAFYACFNLSGRLRLSNNLTRINTCSFGDNHFSGTLRIPNGVVSIGKNAFYGHGFSGDLIIPNSVTTIGDYAFTGCQFTGNLMIPDSVISIGDHAFTRCSGFNGTLTISENITSIGAFAFADCSNLSGDLRIPSGITSIDNYTFSNCEGLTGSLIISDTMETIGKYAFSSCGFTGDLILPDSLTSINQGAFYSCKGFSGNLNISKGITSIDSYVFAFCTGFTGDLFIPNNIISIEEYAFYGCTGLVGDVFIPGSVSQIGSSAFNSSITHVYTPEESSAWTWVIQAYPNNYEEILVPWNNSYTNMSEGFQLSGSFADKIITLPLGSTEIIPAGTVTSRGDDIYRVTFTVNNWNQDGTNNNRYATDVFADHHTKSVNLTSWGAFKIDTTREPFNVPGIYTLNLWASVREGDGVKLDSMTINIGTEAYVQGKWVETYPDSLSTELNGHVDNVDPVLVIKEQDNRYYIQMILTKGGTALRWVDKQYIGDEPWVEPVSSIHISAELIQEYLFAKKFKVNIRLTGQTDGLSVYRFVTSRSRFHLSKILDLAVPENSKDISCLLTVQNADHDDPNGKYELMVVPTGMNIPLDGELASDLPKVNARVVLRTGNEDTSVKEINIGDTFLITADDFGGSLSGVVAQTGGINQTNMSVCEQNNGYLITGLQSTQNIFETLCFVMPNGIRYYVRVYIDSPGIKYISATGNVNKYAPLDMVVGEDCFLNLNYMFSTASSINEEMQKTSPERKNQINNQDTITIDVVTTDQAFDSTNNVISVSSSNPTVVSITSSGKVTLHALSEGRALVHLNSKTCSECFVLIVKSAKNRLKQNEVFMNDGEHYGGDQGHPESNDAQYDEIRSILRRNLGNDYLSSYDTEIGLQVFLHEFNINGCGYVAIANAIINHYLANPVVFESLFGYPLRNSRGYLNFDLLAVDIYSLYRTAGIEGSTRTVIQDLSGVLLKSNIKYIVEDYFNRKGLIFDLVPLDYTEAKQKAQNGQYVLVSLWDTYSYEESYWRDYESVWDGTPTSQSGNHWVTITGYDNSTNEFIISTYGRKGTMADKDYNGLTGGFWDLVIH